MARVATGKQIDVDGALLSPSPPPPPPPSPSSRRAVSLAAVFLAAALTTTITTTAGCGSWMFPVSRRAAEVVHVATDDGWDLALHHFPAAPGAPARRHPLIVCHGIASNRFNWDLTHRLSFPSDAARNGFDTWLVELRASGEASKPGWFDARDYDYTFDDYVLHDVPAAVAFVRQRTHADQVHWVGHSMGGMVVYGYLERVTQATIRSATTVASPIYFSDQNQTLRAGLGWLPPLVWLYDEMPSGSAAAAIAPLAAPAFTWLHHLIWNYDNVSPATARLAAAHATDNISSGVVRQLTQFPGEPRLLSADGVHDYVAALPSITVPMFFVAGSLDQLAPPTVVLHAYERVGSQDKRIEIAARANGYRHDYGHVDLALGEAAPDEIYPLLLNWLQAHD